MSKEKDIIVSGVMFLVALEAYTRLSVMASGKILGVCGPLLRFANALVAAVLISATILSVVISFIYFKNFSQKICEPFLGEASETNEEDEE
ncbi:MAG: hypothetical protein ABEK04_04440 [Candidatus Nanohalobium sp.]